MARALTLLVYGFLWSAFFWAPVQVGAVISAFWSLENGPEHMQRLVSSWWDYWWVTAYTLYKDPENIALAYLTWVLVCCAATWCVNHVHWLERRMELPVFPVVPGE